VDSRLRTVAILMAPVFGLILLAGLFLEVAHVVVLGVVLAGIGALMGWVNYVILRRTRPKSN